MKLDLSVSTKLTLPLVVSKGFIPIPNSECRNEFSRPVDVNAIKIADQYQNYVVLAVSSKKGVVEDEIDDFYVRGCIARITLNTIPSANSCRTKFQVVGRCNITNIDYTNTYLLADVESVVSYISDEESLDVTFGLVKKELQVTNQSQAEERTTAMKFDQICGRNYQMPDLSDALTGLLVTNTKDKYRYLFELDATKRFLYLLEDVRKEKYYLQLEQKIDDDVRKNMTEAQKEYYLREKMRAIQEELGDKGKRDEDIEELRKKIKESKLPESVEKKALNELARYQLMASNAPESNIIKTYLDFLLSLPWSISSTDTSDISEAKRILDEDHYGLDKVKDRILEYLAVKILTNKNPQTILCLVGPPGVGKTSLAKSIARALNKKFIKQSLGGVKDESEIRGHRRTYLGALPGRILQSLAKAKTNNPVFLLDEIDKMSSDYKGDPTSAMLEVLDSEQNKFFSDNYLEEPYDLSNCFFIATANYLGNIPAPLRDRLEIVEVSSYTEYEKFNIAKTYLIKKQLELNGLDSKLFTITDQAIFTIIQKYTREAGVRELERLIGSIVRKSIKKILLDKVENIVIDVDNLFNFLGKARFENSEASKEDLVGVVTGLAYTEFGGDTLQIEVAKFKGQGHLMLTGKLGDVMKESAETALSYVKEHASLFNIDEELFKTHDIHIHVPEGAVPKDGPSAGVTITCAIISALTSTKANHLVGMTGEITLRGRVLPIGGLREKSIAAFRSGLKKILIPRENVRDIDDIPESVRNNLEIIPIDYAMDAIKEILVK